MLRSSKLLSRFVSRPLPPMLSQRNITSQVLLGTVRVRLPSINARFATFLSMTRPQKQQKEFSGTEKQESGRKDSRGYGAVLSRAHHMRWFLGSAAALLGTGTAYALTHPEPSQMEGSSRPTASVSTSSEADNAIASDRLTATYAYTLGGLLLTAASSIASYMTGLTAYLLTLNPWVLAGTSLVAILGSLVAMMSTSYSSNPVIKHILWVVLSAAMGPTLSLVGGHLGSTLILRAAVATACTVGSLSLVGALIPTGTHRRMSGPLSVGLGVLLGATLGQFFWPDSIMIENIVLYGGLLLYGLSSVSDTNALLERARTDPQNRIAKYDPINESTRMYFNAISIFIRILDIMEKKERSSRRDQKPAAQKPAESTPISNP